MNCLKNLGVIHLWCSTFRWSEVSWQEGGLKISFFYGRHKWMAPYGVTCFFWKFNGHFALMKIVVSHLESLKMAYNCKGLDFSVSIEFRWLPGKPRFQYQETLLIWKILLLLFASIYYCIPNSFISVIIELYHRA